MFSPANSKLKKLYDFPGLQPWFSNKRKVYSFDTLAGHACPFALKCFAKVEITDGKRKMVDGPDQEFRCYAASQEVRLTNVYNKHAGNFERVRGKSSDQILSLLRKNKPSNMGVCRIHTAGDFISPMYFRGWLKFAESNPTILFYAYTKSLPYWVDMREDVPENLILTASYGGRRDDLIPEHRLRSAIVVHSEADAASLGLEIDRDDSHASDPTHRDSDFALEIHGSQRAGTEAAVAWEKIRRGRIKV